MFHIIGFLEIHYLGRLGKVKDLPTSYTDIDKTYVKTKCFEPPASNQLSISNFSPPSCTDNEELWLDQVSSNIKTQHFRSWSAYHSYEEDAGKKSIWDHIKRNKVAIFEDESNTPASISK